jgi:hypothetical protein
MSLAGSAASRGIPYDGRLLDRAFAQEILDDL